MLLLTLVHIYGGKLRFLQVMPRSRWLSFAGGVSVAYVFVHLLPELSEAQETITDATLNGLAFLERHVYLVALLGLVIFYGLERMALRSRNRDAHPAGRTENMVFWLHISSFAVYNGLIGYFLLHREDEGLSNLILFSIAMLLHFVVNDYGLREHHKELYRSRGRWVLVAAIAAGWFLGLVLEVSELVLAVLLAFIAGGVILNVLKEELPEERESRFSAFLLGTVVYTLILLAF
jgi:zinc transporter ZupT